SGQSFLLNANGSNLGTMFVVLKEFDERKANKELYAAVILKKLNAELNKQIEEAQIAVLGAPPVDGIGSAGGFKLMVEDRGNAGMGALQAQVDNICAKARSMPQIGAMFTQFRSSVPQLYADIDRVKCKRLGVGLNDMFNTLQVYLGGYYVNDFNEFGRTWQVNLQADASFRLKAEDVRQLKVRNSAGEMVPLATVATVEDVGGPLMITRYNMQTAAPLNGA